MRTLNHLAFRLGVKPMPPEHYAIASITGPDGTKYDIIEMFHGLLDFIEKKGNSGDLHRSGDPVGV